MSKDALRREVRAARRQFVGGLMVDDRKALERALAAIVAPLLNDPIASYAAYGSEIDPRFVEGHAPALLFPRVEADRLSFHFATYGDLVPGHAGILEPAAFAKEQTPAAILVPLVAVDLSGNRIGQGAGHYDRTLAALRAAGPVTAIGLAWEVQIVPTIAADAWDQPLDWLATPLRLVDCRANR